MGIAPTSSKRGFLTSKVVVQALERGTAGREMSSRECEDPHLILARLSATQQDPFKLSK